MSDIHFQGFWRMDWGLGNPNKTAALIATLMVAVWIFAYIRKWGFWPVLILFTGLGVCLIHTFSRGGLIAAAAGLAVLLWKTPLPWQRSRVIAAGISLWVIVGFSVFVQAHERYSQGVTSEDRSITNRIALWKSAPMMMVDAPGGWGIGQSGVSYMRWYQPLDRNESYRTLVNSHLTWLVEFGWLGRFFYLTAWLLILIICWPSAKARVLAVPLAIWTCFGVSAGFSSVAESPWLWIVPSLALIFTVYIRLFRHTWPARTQFIGPPLGAALICGSILLIGGNNGSLVRKERGFICYGQGVPEYTVIADPTVLGGNYPRTLRLFKNRADLPAVAIAESLAPVFYARGTTLVLTGSAGTNQQKTLGGLVENAGRLILVNPAFFPQEIGIDKKRGNSEAVFGEFAQSPSQSAWIGVVTSSKNLPGVGDFVPEWPIRIFKEIQSHNE